MTERVGGRFSLTDQYFDGVPLVDRDQKTGHLVRDDSKTRNIFLRIEQQIDDLCSAMSTLSSPSEMISIIEHVQDDIDNLRPQIDKLDKKPAKKEGGSE